MNRLTFYDTHTASLKLERERELLTRGIDPFASISPRAADTRTVTVPSLPATAGSFARAVEAAITAKLGAKRYTRPSEAEGEPDSFAEKLRQAVERRRPKARIASPANASYWRR